MLQYHTLLLRGGKLGVLLAKRLTSGSVYPGLLGGQAVVTVRLLLNGPPLSKFLLAFLGYTGHSLVVFESLLWPLML